jgi:hypothetical protein
MATVVTENVFPAGATVQLTPRVAHAPAGAGEASASGEVREDSVLVIEDVEPGAYWASVEGSDAPPVLVRAKEDVRLPGSVEERAAIRSGAAPGRSEVSRRIEGARTSGNTRPLRRTGQEGSEVRPAFERGPEAGALPAPASGAVARTVEVAKARLTGGAAPVADEEVYDEAEYDESTAGEQPEATAEPQPDAEPADAEPSAEGDQATGEATAEPEPQSEPESEESREERPA